MKSSNLRLALFYLLLFTFIVPSQAQNCYTDYRNKGIDYMDRKDYGEAISQFVAALVTCKDVPSDNDLSRRIEESKRKWANDLQASVTEAQTAYREALAAQKVAENAKAAEGEARKKAEENAVSAFKRGVRAESFRLALLADMARQQGRKTDALLLSWMGLQLSDTVQPYVMHSFGEAVRDSFSTTFFNTPEEIRAIQFLHDGDYVLLQTSTLDLFLVHLSTPLRVTQLPAKLYHVALSPADNRFLAWGNDNNISIFNSDGKAEASISGHKDLIRMAVFSPDGQKILTCSSDKTAKLWDKSGNQITTLEGHSGKVQNGCFSPDGSQILTRSADGTAKLWDASGHLLRTFSEDKNFVYRSFFSSNNAVFLQLSNGAVQIWNEKGVLVNTTETEPLYLRYLISSTDGKYLAVRSAEMKLLIFDAAGAQKTTLAHPASLAGYIFSDDNRHIITWASDHVARLWNTGGELLMEYKGNRGGIIAASYNADKKILLTTCSDGTSKLWDQAGNLLTEWQLGTKTPVESIFSPLGDRVLCLGEGSKNASLSPLPQDIYNKADRNTLLKSEALNSAKQLYGIQFLETLSSKK